MIGLPLDEHWIIYLPLEDSSATQAFQTIYKCPKNKQYLLTFRELEMDEEIIGTRLCTHHICHEL